MRARSRSATSVRRPLARSSFSKNSRRQGAGNEIVSRRCTASMSCAVAVRISTSSRILFLLQLHLGFGEADIDRRHVAIAVDGVVQRQLARPPRTAGGDVAVLQKIGGVDDQRRVVTERIELLALRQARLGDCRVPPPYRQIHPPPPRLLVDERL